MSLRARLLTVVVSLTAVGLIVAGIATYASLRSFLVDRVDRTVTAGAQSIERSLERGRVGPGGFDALGAANPGIYIGSVDASGIVRWAPVGTRPGETPLPQPVLSAQRAKRPPMEAGPFTVSAVSGDTRFRVGLEPLGDGARSSSSRRRSTRSTTRCISSSSSSSSLPGRCSSRRCSRVSGSFGSACAHSGGSS